MFFLLGFFAGNGPYLLLPFALLFSCRQTSFTVCFSENQVKVNAFMLPDGGADPNFPNGGQ